MERGSYKKLFIKLSSTAFGLVVMLGGTSLLIRDLQQNYSDPVFSSELKTVNSVPKGEIALSDPAKLSRQNDTAVVTPENLHRISRLIKSRLHIVEALGEAIGSITERTAIPVALKQNILADLERQLSENQKKLAVLESYLAPLSGKVILSKSGYSPESHATDMIKKSLIRARKKSLEALYWI